MLRTGLQFTIIILLLVLSINEGFGQIQEDEWLPLKRVGISSQSLNLSSLLDANLAASDDTVSLDIEIQVGTSQDFSQSIGSCFGATGFTDSDNLPSFITHTTNNVTINGLGSVRARFTLSVAPDAPDSTFQSSIIYCIFRGGSECRCRTLLLNIKTTPALIPVADFTVSRQSILAGGSVNFTDLSINAITDWLWDFGDGQASADQNPTHTYAAAGTYSVSLTVTGPAGSNTEIRANYISVAPLGTPGQQIWSFDTGGGIFSSPAIGDDGTIYIGSSGRSVHAINPDGTEKWRLNPDSRVYDSPVIGVDGVSQQRLRHRSIFQAIRFQLSLL